MGAGYTPADLDFVEGHGTGTSVGDQIELKGVFQAQSAGQTPTARRTGMTSLKSIIGHTKAAAGIGAFIKTAMAVNRRILPPTGSCTDPNPVFKDTCHSLYPLMHGTVTDPAGKVRAGVSAMGFGGINSHITLESGDAPSDSLSSRIDEHALLASNQTSEVFVFTASTYAQLTVEIANLKKTVADLSVGDLIDLSAEMSLRATNDLPIRAAVIAGSVKDLLGSLDTLQLIVSNDPPGNGKSTRSIKRDVWVSNRCDQSRVGFLFPGQGSQQLAMARKLVSRYGWAREMVAAADSVQAEAGLPTVSNTVFVDLQRAIDTPTATALRQALARTEIAQVAIVTASAIYARYLELMGVKPVACGGHSLGELTALHQAGAFDFKTLLQLVSLRGRAMAAPADQAGAMAALFCSRAKAESLVAAVDGYAVLANINSPKQVVISGDEAAILTIIHEAAEHDISTARINVSNAFHSKYVQAAADTLGQQAPVPQRPERLDIELFSCVDGCSMSANVDLCEYLSRQVISSVDFFSMVEAIESQCDMLIEVGPNKVLSKLTSDILSASDVDCQPTSSNPDVDCDMNQVLAKAFVSGVDVQWKRLFENRLARPFVPADERIFITNPCENPIAEVGKADRLFPKTATDPLKSTQENLIEPSAPSNSMATSHTNSAPLTNTRIAPMSRTEPTPPETMQEQPNDGIQEAIIEIVAERTGFPAGSIAPDLRLLDDLNMDSIKAGDVIASAARKLGALGPIDPASLADASIADVVAAVRAAKGGEPAANGSAPIATTAPPTMSTTAPASAPMAMPMPMVSPKPTPMVQAPTPKPLPTQGRAPQAPAPLAAAPTVATTAVDDGVEAIIMEIIAERTGFPKETLTGDLRLLDDLNMDSIKAGDVIASAARKLGALGPIDPASLADASIGDVVVAVRAAKSGETASMPLGTTEATNPLPSSMATRSPAALSMPMPTAPVPLPVPANPMASSPPMPTPVPMTPAPMPNPAPISAPTASPAASAMDDGVEHIIVDIIAERTGFPRETLTSDLRLLDDLNMDSIKAGDVIASAARKLGALGPIDPASLADASIGDVVLAVREAKNGEASPLPSASADQATTTQPPVAMATTQAPTPMSTPTASMPGPPPMVSMSASTSPMAAPATAMETATQNNQDWVDNFDIEFVPHRPNATQQDIGGRHFRVLYSAGNEAFMAKLADQFHERKASISFETFEQEGKISGDPHVAGAPLYVIAILPRKSGMGTSQERVQRMIHRLRRAVGSTKFNSQPIATGVTFVQFGNGRFGLEGMNDIETCSAAGFARALHLESQALEVRIIDFADKLSHILSTDFITNEVAAAGNFRDCAYDALGRRFETRHRKVQPNDYPTQPLTLNGSDVILVSGGARGITAELALAIAKRTGANFALVGSSPHPSQSSAAAATEITANLQRFATLPGKCEYFSCDLSNEIAVRNLIKDVESTLGRVTGVIHGAGRNNPKMASAATGEEVLSEISPKVLGALNLIEALGDRSLNCFIGLTSIIGVTGIPGNSWYAFSNETLDLLLRQYKIKNPNALVRSVSYSAWCEVGMGAQTHVETALRRMGVGLIPPKEGVARFMYALEHDLNDPQLIVTGALGAIDTWRPSDSPVSCSNSLVPATPRSMSRSNRYVGDVVSHQPGTSVVTRVKLSHANDPYLLDHIYEGTCLFPAVFGLEAMAQVASYLMPERPRLVRLQNIALSRPIIVGNEGAVELELRAETKKQCLKSGETTIFVAIRTERTQFHFEHFSCEVVFGTPVVGEIKPTQVGKRLDIDPERDLYTGILFQGPLFRRWRDTYHLEEGKMTFDVGHCTKTLRGEGIFGPSIASDATLTGDPYFRDVLLQSVQAIIPQKTGLPLSIEKIEFFAPSATDADARSDRRLVTSMLHQIGDEVGKEHIAEIVATDATGTIRERITGYKVKVLAIKEEYPTACELADLASFDQALLEKQTMNAFQHAGARAPVMVVKRMPELHGMSRDERRFREKPLLSGTVHKLKVQNSGNNAAPWIDWLPTGKPIVGDDPVCSVSLSHDDDYCLCVANLVHAGCDIQPISERSREQWDALLGMHNSPVLDQLVASGDCLNKAGTRVWAAVEAVQKSIDEATPVALQMGHAKDGAIRLMSDQLDEGSVLVTMPISLHRTPQRIVAVVAPTNAAANEAPKLLPRAHAPDMPGAMNAQATTSGNDTIANSNAETKTEPKMRSDVAVPGEHRAIENVKAEIKWDGPRDQAVFEHRFVVTFKECATRGKHVQHTQYCGWMGQMRENGLLYLVPDMVLKLSDGLSGMATNWTDVDVVGEAMMGDVIVARLWMVSMTEASVVLGCDYSKVLPGNRLERLAYVEQATTWVRLDGRNDPTKEAFPKFLFDAFKSMEPRSNREQVLPELPASLGRLKIEQAKLETLQPHAPVVVWGEDFSTCLDDSNIVANIYYARYFHWQWRTSDLFFYDKVPHLMTGDVAMGNVRELVPLNSRIDYMRDAFPFDRIRTELQVTRSTDVAATFQFIHYRMHEDGSQEKLSAGTQDVVWVRRTPNGTAVPEPFPLAVRQAFNGQAESIHQANC